MSEVPRCYSESNPTARKQHHCSECRGIISKGEKYHVFSGVWDSPWRYKTCEDCQQLRKDFSQNITDHDELPAFGSLYEDVFQSRDNHDWVVRFNSIRSKRNAPESPRRWMEDFNKEKP